MPKCPKLKSFTIEIFGLKHTSKSDTNITLSTSGMKYYKLSKQVWNLWNAENVAQLLAIHLTKTCSKAQKSEVWVRLFLAMTMRK